MKKSELVAGTVYTAARRPDEILAYLVDDRRWYMDRTVKGVRFTLVAAGLSAAQERAQAPYGAKPGYLVLIFREGASVDETEAAWGLTAADLVGEDGYPRHDLLPRFTRLETVSHLWLEPLGF